MKSDGKTIPLGEDDLRRENRNLLAKSFKLNNDLMMAWAALTNANVPIPQRPDGRSTLARNYEHVCIRLHKRDLEMLRKIAEVIHSDLTGALRQVLRDSCIVEEEDPLTGEKRFVGIVRVQ